MSMTRCKVTQLHPAKQIDEQAANWLAKLVSNSLTQKDKDTFQAWCDADPRHHQALLELADIWDELDTLSELAQLMPIENVLDAKANTPSHKLDFVSTITDCLKPRWVPVAALLMITASLFLSLSEFSHQSTLNPPTVLTQVGEKRSMTLSDGSVLTLNTDTRIEMNFSESERNLTLLQGEAHFEVAKDKQRPFIVNVDGVQVRAIGTAFNIQKSLGHMEVIVTEGVIEFDQSQAPFLGTERVAPCIYAT